MTTFTLPSYYVELNDDGQAELFRKEPVSLVFAPGIDNLNYVYLSDAQAETGEQITTPPGQFYSLLIDGTPFSIDEALPRIIEVKWDGNTTFVAILERVGIESGEFGENILILGGAPVDINSAAEYNAFNAGIDAFAKVSGGAFGPGADIPLASLPDVQITEDDVIFGTGGGEGDDFRGGTGDDLLQGNAGPDTLRGGAGNDTLNGGNGDDLLVPGANPGDFDVLFPGLGSNDIRLAGDYGEDGGISLFFDDFEETGVPLDITINADGSGGISYPGEGQSTISGADDPMEASGLNIGGTFYDDTFDITPSDDGWVRILSTQGQDTINIGDHSGLVVLDYGPTPFGGVTADLGAGTVDNDGFGGTDTITGRVTELRGSFGDDDFTGSANDERFILGPGNDMLDAGGGVDEIRYDRSGVGFVEVNLVLGTAAGLWDGITFEHILENVENVRGSREGNDRIEGNDADNRIRAGGGDDILLGGLGDDTLDGGDGFDSVTIRATADTISVRYTSEGIEITSDDGVDVLRDIEEIFFQDAVFTAAAFDQAYGPQSQVIDGTDGDDDLVAGPGGDTIIAGDGDDTVTGGIGDDALAGGAGNDDIAGEDGNDNISSSDGDDYAEGGPGDDQMGGGFGNDTMLGNGGNDFMGGGLDNDSMNGGDGNDVVNGGPGDDTIFGGAGADTIGASFGNDSVNGQGGNDDLGGGTGRDVVRGGAGDDTIGAGEGDDTVYGDDGDDFLAGGGRNDVIEGGAGNDTINGGAGDDTMTGNSGADEFVFNGFTSGDEDIVTDFAVGFDSFRMVGIDKAPGSGLQGFIDALDITDTGSGALMTYQGHTILVSGVAASDLTLDSFDFL